MNIDFLKLCRYYTWLAIQVPLIYMMIFNITSHYNQFII